MAPAPAGEVRVVPDVAAAFADLVVAEAPTSIALSGGGTAEACYRALAGRAGAVHWPSVTVLFGDERWVPVADPDSNEGMARRVLLDRAAPAAVHSLRGAGDDIGAAASAYTDVVASLAPLRLVHLGLGPDGHTASLFPASPALDEDVALVVPTGDDDHPHARLTFTFPAIAGAHLVVVTVAGAEKAEAWARVCRGDDVPAARITAERVLWLVDPAAAVATPDLA